ncbi:hypothetical protein Tco_0658934 [Tanacetum coccineum]
MPLSDKTILDSHCFVHELKKEMNDDLEYVKSLEKEVDELESEKADFSNIYDLLLEECVSKDVTCSYLHSLSDLNANTELQCFFSKLEKHSISLELALQQCKEQMKNNSVCKENGSNVFRKEREQYHEIQDLKAQMQDKNIAISELKKLIENCKGKSVETQFNKPSVVRQPNAQRIPKPSVLGKPTPFSNSPEMRKYLSRLNPRTSAQNKDAKSHKTTKRYMPVEKLSASKKPERQIPTGHRFSNKKTTTVPEKTMNPKSCLRWKPTGRIFSNVRLRWIPTGKLLNSCTGKVENEPTHGSNVDIHHIHACKQALDVSAGTLLSAGTSLNGQNQQRIDLNADALYNEKQENLRVWLLKLLISKKPVPEWPRSLMLVMMSVHISSGLVLYQMTFDHNRSELGIQDHINEQSSSMLVPKVVP